MVGLRKGLWLDTASQIIGSEEQHPAEIKKERKERSHPDDSPLHQWMHSQCCDSGTLISFAFAVIVTGYKRLVFFVLHMVHFHCCLLILSAVI